MNWLARIVLAVVAAFVAFVICWCLITFLPDMKFVIANQVAGLVARFINGIVVIVFFVFLLFGHNFGPWRAWRIGSGA
jgi:hypothetical protein